MRILTSGLKVYGFGEKKTPTPFISACSIFLYLETIDQSTDVDVSKASVAGVRKTAQELKQDTKLMNLLRGAVASTKDEDGWSRLSVIGTHIANQASFESRNYGYAKLSSIFEVVDLFEMRRKDKAIYVKTRKKK